MALLLFLVCAAISASVITAGSVVNGRLSQMQEMDQRYYSLSSAAELVRDVICKEAVTFNQTLDTKEVMTEESTTRDISVSTKIGGSEPNATNHMLDYASALLTFGTKWSGSATETEDDTGAGDEEEGSATRSEYEKIEDIWDAMLPEEGSTPGGTKPQWQFTVKPGSGGEGIIPVKVTATLDDEELVFAFENDDPGKEKLTMTMICTPDAPVIKNEKVVSSSTTVDTETSGSGTEEVVKVTTTTIEKLTHDVVVNWTKENCIIER